MKLETAAPIPPVLVADDDDSVETLRRIHADPVAEQSRHITSPALAATHRGLPLLDDVEYPDSVLEMHRAATADVLRLHFVHNALFVRGVERAGETADILVREFARRDRVSLMFTLLHLMRQHDVPRSAVFYRSLMFACCKYDDLEWGLFVLENMAHDQHRDVAATVRLFDSFTACADRRAWHVLDVLCAVAPGLHRLARYNLLTAAVLTAMAATFRLGRSTRAKRGFITLPNNRGEHANPWRHTVGGIQTYLEVDWRTGEFHNPLFYDERQRELEDVMLEQQDGYRLRHWHDGTSSLAMDEGRKLLAEVVYDVQTTLKVATRSNDAAHERLSAPTDQASATAATAPEDAALPAHAQVAELLRNGVQLPHGKVDERIVNALLGHNGEDKTRPVSWNDQPFAWYRRTQIVEKKK